MTSKQWPERTAVCLQCRKTYADTSQPHCGDHSLLSLRSRSDRDRLISHVWGMPIREKSRSWLPSRRGFAGLLFIVALICTPLAAVGVMADVLLAVSTVSWFGSLLAVLMDEGERRVSPASLGLTAWCRERDTPLPGVEPPLLLGGASGLLGTVDRGHEHPSPLSGVSAVAFCVTLTAHHSDGGRLLVDAATLGFLVTTNDGEEIAVPPGPLTIVGHGGSFIEDREAIEGYLLEFDPLRRHDRDRDPFEYQAAIEITVRIGDHVVVHNSIKRSAPPSWLTAVSPGPLRGYRDMAPGHYTVEGLPHIEILP